MDSDPDGPATGSRVLATVAAAPSTRLLTRAWWVSVGAMSAVAYLTATSASGVAAPLGSSVFLAGLFMIAAVARNASAETRSPGVVRRGSVLRAGLFGVVIHGGLLASVTLASGVATLALLWVVLGGALVALTRPVTLVALAAEAPLPPRAPSPSELSTPQLVSALRASAAQVRSTSDPARKAALAEQRGQLIATLADRDPSALALLLDDSSEFPPPSDGPDGPQAV